MPVPPRSGRPVRLLAALLVLGGLSSGLPALARTQAQAPAQTQIPPQYQPAPVPAVPDRDDAAPSSGDATTPAAAAEDGTGNDTRAGSRSVERPAVSHRDPLADLTPAERQRLRVLLETPASRTTTAPAAKPAATPAAAKPAAAAAAKPAPVSVNPDGLAGQLLDEVSGVRDVVLGTGNRFVSLFGDIALTGRWLHHQTVDTKSRAALIDVAGLGLLVVLAALGIEHLALLALRRPLRALNREAQLAQEEAAAAADAAASDALPDPAVPGTVQQGPPAPPPVLLAEPTPGAALPGSPILPTRPLPDPILDADPAAGTTIDTEAGSGLATRLAEASATRSAEHAEARSRDAAHRRRTLRVFRRIPFALLRLLLKLLPLGLFLLLCDVGGPLLTTSPRTALVLSTVADIYAIGRVIWLVFDALFAPRAPGVRLVAAGDGTARLTMRWLAWLIGVPVVSICFAATGHVLGLPSRAASAVQRLMVLIEHLIFAALIWRVRFRVAAALHPPRRLRERTLGRIVTRLVDYWWVVALFFDAAFWFVWAAQIRGGYNKMWRIFVVSSVVVLGARLVTVMLLGGLDRAFRPAARTGTDATATPVPNRFDRALRYYPALRRFVTWAVAVVAILLMLQLWGVPVGTFLTRTSLGTRLTSAVLTILLTLVIGVFIWEGVNGALDRQVGRFTDTNQAARAVRLRTLLPILRTLLLVVLGVIVALTVLSEIGVNIAPLLAGAGIIGVAVGFGSQKLVQDFITGIFLLVENAMQVGDTVTVAGITGTVEHLSIRTLRLRGGDGSIQIIPFSSVSTVANQSRDYMVAAINVSIAFSEDTDRMVALMTETGAALREDPEYADRILADFALNGVDSIGEYAVAMSGTMKCTVAGRWPVQREFLRRLRAGMAERGIAMPRSRQSLEVQALDLPNFAGADRDQDRDGDRTLDRNPAQEQRHG